MSKPLKIVRALIRDDATALGLLAARVYPVDATPQNATRPYATMERLSDIADRDLDGTIDQRVASVRVAITADTYDGAEAVVTALTAALEDKSGTVIVSGVTVNGTEVDDVSDEPDGPVDLDDGEAFVSELTVNMTYL